MKPSFYNFFVTSLGGDRIIAYNSFQGSFLTLSEEEFEEAKAILEFEGSNTITPWVRSGVYQKLVTCGCLIENSVDEQSILRQRRAANDEEARGLAITVAPTLQCNFACSYCFEEHPQKRMTSENILAIERYVDTLLADDSLLHVTWFGGEPLLAFDIIARLSENFTRVCEQRGCRFSQSIITNGSLLSNREVDFFVSQRNFKYVQITIDGPPEIHDRRRKSAGGRGTFERIVGNIGRAADKLPITVRVNIDRTNYHCIPQLVDILAERGLEKRVSLYLGQVLPTTDISAHVSSIALTKEEFAQIESQFQFYMLQRGFGQICPLPKPLFGRICIADNPNGAVFAPENLVFHCWTETAMSENAASGTVDPAWIPHKDDSGRSFFGTKRDDLIHRTQMMAINDHRWQVYDPFACEMCRTCKVQPLCMGGCPWDAHRDPYSPWRCPTLKFNLVDRLRIYHLQRALAEGINKEVSGPMTASACQD